MSTKDHMYGTRPRRSAKDRVRLFNKHVPNPAMLLPYGTHGDRLRNVLAAGR